MFRRSRTRFLLLIVVLLLAGCSWPGGDEPVQDPLRLFRNAMRPGQADLLDDLPPLPIYRIDVTVDPDNRSLNGNLTLTIPPEPDGAVPIEYNFRLYPNLSYYRGMMDIDLASVNGQGAPFSYTATDTALHVAVPPEAALPGEPVIIGLQWRLRLPQWEPGQYTLFGRSEGILSLPLFYPILAARDEEGEWRLDLGHPQGDAAFSEAALYQVAVTVPEGVTVASTGSVLNVIDSPYAEPTPEPTGETRRWKEWRIASGPAREFALFVSDQFRLAEANANGVAINSWYLAGDERTGRAAAEYAATAVRLYEDVFGPYPYRELDVVAGPLTFRGMEYPGLFELGIDLYRDSTSELETRIAHEVAHQWWYNIVGNDPVNTPWLDEGLAEFSTYYYRQKTGGQDAADSLAQQRWQLAYDNAVATGLDAPVDQPVEAFQPNNYELMVYAKAALFFHALRQEMGDEQLQALLRRYLETYQFRVATPEDFLALAEEYGGPAARDLYRQWILEASAPPEPEESAGEN